MGSTVDARSTPANSELSTDRMVRLQSVIASLSGTLTPKEVADTVLDQAMQALRADAGSVVVATDDGTRLQRISAVGYPPEVLARFGNYTVADPFPMTEAMQTGEAIWLSSLAEWKERYPDLTGFQEELGFTAGAVIPLIADGRKLGVFALSFTHPLERNSEDRAFALTLAQQCAQALDRSRLYAAERAARAQAEAERARLYDLFMRAPARIALSHGPDHIYVFANQQYVAELDDPNIIGRSAREVFPNAEDQGIIAVADRVFATGEPYVAREALFRVDRDQDGKEEDRYFDVVLQPSYEPDGTIGGVMLYSMDVTEGVLSRQRVEQLLAERNAILGQIAEGLLIVDANRRIVFANETATRVAGIDATGMTLEAYAKTLQLARSDGALVLSTGFTVDEARRTGQITLMEHRLRRPDGAEVIVQGSVAPVTGENGTQLGAVVTFRDVTARRTLERQKDDFLAAAAHDLKTPLTTIKGVAQILQRRVGRWGTPEAEHLMHDLDRIDSTVSKMNLLINKLLDITRLQMDQPLTLEKRATDLVAVTRAVIDDQQTISKHHTIRLESDAPEIVGSLDAFRIERVVTNLLSNSIRYSPQGGEICVAIRKVSEANSPWAVITVHDNGVGIPTHDVAYIFDRFYRASNVEGTIAGAGIGLAGVRQIVEQHGGSISADSSEDQGTTFTVRLPLDG
jgi:PAS domain S-box-containing protein